jgi:hypothetical protein
MESAKLGPSRSNETTTIMPPRIVESDSEAAYRYALVLFSCALDSHSLFHSEEDELDELADGSQPVAGSSARQPPRRAAAAVAATTAQEILGDEEELEDEEVEEEEVDEVESEYDESSAAGTPAIKTPLRLKLKLGGGGAQSPLAGQLKGKAKGGRKRTRMEGEPGLHPWTSEPGV